MTEAEVDIDLFDAEEIAESTLTPSVMTFGNLRFEGILSSKEAKFKGSSIAFFTFVFIVLIAYQVARLLKNKRTNYGKEVYLTNI
jgi:hypothetical protein